MRNLKLVRMIGLTGILAIVGCSEAPMPDVRIPVQGQSPGAGQTPAVVRGAIQFVQGYGEGYELAKKTDRPMLLFFTAQWCHFCHQMEQDAFVDESVSSLAKRFVCILVDADLEPEVCKTFDVRGYPTILFMTSRGVPLNQLTGRRSANQLVSQMEAALEAAAVRAQQTGQSVIR